MQICSKCASPATVKTESGKFSLCTNCFVSMYPEAINTNFQIIPELVYWQRINASIIQHEEASAQADLMYSPLEAAVDLVTKMAVIEVELQKLTLKAHLPNDLEFDKRTSKLLDKCIDYIDTQIPQVASDKPVDVV